MLLHRMNIPNLGALSWGLRFDGLDPMRAPCTGCVRCGEYAEPASWQFEFVQSQWINDGDFISQGSRTDPIVGRRDLADDFQFPARPARRRVAGLAEFTATRGGEHVFLPGIGGLRWLADEH